jgi:sugar phosphate isomerase/epimerase
VFDYAYSAIAMIRAFSGVKVLIENIPNDISTVERLQEFRSAAQLADIGFCYDAGHERSSNGTPDRWKDVHLIHLNDNRGGVDEHIWPFDGSRNWPAFIAELVEADYSGSFIFEVVANNEIAKGQEAGRRLNELWDEAASSLEEFRLKYRLPLHAREEES